MDVLQPIHPQLQKDFHIPTGALQGREGGPAWQKPLSWVSQWPKLAHLPALESSNRISQGLGFLTADVE